MANDESSAPDEVQCLEDRIASCPRSGAGNNSVAVMTLVPCSEHVRPTPKTEQQVRSGSQPRPEVLQSIRPLGGIRNELQYVSDGHEFVPAAALAHAGHHTDALVTSLSVDVWSGRDAFGEFQRVHAPSAPAEGSCLHEEPRAKDECVTGLR